MLVASSFASTSVFVCGGSTSENFCRPSLEAAAEAFEDGTKLGKPRIQFEAKWFVLVVVVVVALALAVFAVEARSTLAKNSDDDKSIIIITKTFGPMQKKPTKRSADESRRRDAFSSAARCEHSKPMRKNLTTMTSN